MDPAQKAEAYFKALSKGDREEAHRHTHLTWKENHTPEDIPEPPFSLDRDYDYHYASDTEGIAKIDLQIRHDGKVHATCSLIRETAPDIPSPVEGEWGVDPVTIKQEEVPGE